MQRVCLFALAVLIIALSPGPALSAGPEDLLRSLFGVQKRQDRPQARKPQAPPQSESAVERGLDKAAKARIQTELNRRGFDVGKADGAFGRGTRAGIGRYQESRSEAVTGYLTATQVTDLLGSAQPAVDPRMSVLETEAGFDVFRGYDLPGNDLERHEGWSVGSCRAVCMAESSCGAFTYNTEKSVCLLKSGAGQRKRFSAAISGVKNAEGVAMQDVFERDARGEFDVRHGIDLPGNDLGERLTALTLTNCQNLCSGQRECKGYTYNVEKRVCFLKEAIGKELGFDRAISGIKLYEDDAEEERQDTRTLAEVVSGPTRPAPVSGGWIDLPPAPAAAPAALAPRQQEWVQKLISGRSCEESAAQFDRARQAMRVSLSADSVRAGDKLVLRWQRPDVAADLPAFLVISFDQPVRFRAGAGGFYTLMPTAAAPFGFVRFAEHTRAVVPLHPEGTEQSGWFEIRFLNTGETRVSWDLVGFSRCGESASPADVVSALPVTVQLGAPHVLPQSAFASRQPLSILRSSDGGRRIELFETHFVLSAVIGGVGHPIRSVDGTLPAFSPSGRFITYVPGSSEGLAAMDAVDGADMLYAGGNWIWDDSFFVMGNGIFGGFVFGNSLVERGIIGDAQLGPFAVGWNGPLALDLENNLFAAQASDTIVRSMTADRGSYQEYLQTRETDPEFSRAARATGGVLMSKRFDFEGGDSLVEIAGAYGAGPQAGSDGNTASGEVADAGGASAAAFAADAAASARTAVMRGAQRMYTSPSAYDPDKTYADQLARIGIAVDRSAAPLTTITSEDRAALDTLIARIRTLPPAQAGMIRDDVRNSLGDPARCHDIETQAAANYSRSSFSASDVTRISFSDGPGQRLYLVEITCDNVGARIGESYWTENYVFGTALPTEPLDIRQLEIESFGHANASGWGDRAIVGFTYLPASERLIAWSPAAQTVIDLDRQKVVSVRETKGVRGAIDRFLPIDGDMTKTLQLGSDGSFHLTDLATGEEPLSGTIIDDEVVVWNGQGYFDATNEGADFVSLRFPGADGLFTFQQFDRQLRRKGLAVEIVEGRFSEPDPAYARPPTVTGEASHDNGRIRATVTAWPGDSPVRELRVYQDGVLTDRLSTADGAFKVDVAAIEGTRWVTLLAEDSSGLVSQPISLDVGLPATRTSHVLAIGIDTYDDPGLQSLRYGRSDAVRFAAAIPGSAAPALTDHAASPEAILGRLDALVSAARPGDNIVLYFAGHGIQDRDGKYYLATTGTDLDDLAGTALAWEALAARIRSAPTRIAIFLDTCHSGSAGTQFFASNDDAADAIIDRFPANVVVFSASRGREFSIEGAEFGGGVFTSALVSVFADAGHDLNQNGTLEISEMYSAVKTKVQSLTSSRQTPWLSRSQLVGDFAFF